jgi:hypothetical protein
MAGEISKFLESIRKDPPFSYPDPDERTNRILVENNTLALYQQELGYRLKASITKSTITTIIGRAGSGKTHFLQNLAYRINIEKKYSGLVIYQVLHGENYDMKGLIHGIVNNKVFKAKAKELNLDLDKYEEVDAINAVISQMQSKDDTAGLILAIDRFDEHLRQREVRAREMNVSPTVDLEQFLGLYSLLIGDEYIKKGLCVIFSLTDQGFEKLFTAIGDPSLARRFDIPYHPNDPSKVLRLERFSDNESFKMISEYMEYWTTRTKVILPLIEECSVNKMNIFPFTEKALRLIISASDGFPGPIICGCKNATERMKSGNKWNEIYIRDKEAAQAINVSQRTFPAYDAIKSMLTQELKEPDVLKEISEWQESVARVKYNSNIWDANFPQIFEKFFNMIINENNEPFKIKGPIKFRSKYSDNDFKLDLVVSLDDNELGIIFSEKAIIDERTAKPIIAALISERISHAVFIYAGKKPEMSFKGNRKEGIDSDVRMKLVDDLRGKDFRVVTKLIPIYETEAWGLIMANETSDNERRKTINNCIEGRLQIISQMYDLMSAKPGRHQDSGFKYSDLDF